MARTGTEFGRISGSYKTHNIGTYQLASQDIANNKSTFTLKSYFTYEGGTEVTSSFSTFKLDGTTVKTGSYGYTPGDHQLGSKDIQITHNNDGSFPGKYVSIEANSYHMKGSKSGQISGVPTIPRASSVTATSACVEEATSINISRASSNFKHTLKYSFKGLTGTISTNVDTNYGWIIPASFYEKMDSKEADCTIICETYNGTNKIGEKSITFKVRVDEEKSKPNVSATFKDVNSKTVSLTGNNQKIVKFYSNVQIAISATGKNGATIKSKSVVCEDGKFRTSDGIINEVESGKFTVSAIDSRSIVSSKDYNLAIVNYIKLSLNVEVYRPQPTTGEIAVNFKGNYFNGSFGQVSNTLHILYRYKQMGTSNWSSWKELNPIISSNSYSNGNNPISLGKVFTYTEIYDFEFRANDKINTANEVIFSKTVAAGIPVCNWGKENFDINVMLFLHDAMKKRVSLIDLIYPVGSIYLSVNNINPSTFLGGTWVAWGTGRVPVGVDANQTEFNTVEKKGGSKYLQEHTHDVKGTYDYVFNIDEVGETDWYRSYQATGEKWAPTFKNSVNRSWDKLIANSSGIGQDGNLQPYITCYMWKRTE